MPMIPFQPNTRIRSADVNANFANALALDTPRTVIVTHTWNALQVFGQGIQVTGATTFDGDISVTGDLSVSDKITSSDVLQAARFLAANDGSSSNLSYGFVGGGVGIYREGPADLRFVAGNTGRMRITGTSIEALGPVVFTGDGSGLTDLPAGNLTGTIAAGVNVPANRLTGTIALEHVPNLPASKVTTGEMLMARLPLLQFTVSMSALNVGPNVVHVEIVSANGVTPSSAGFVNVQEGVITGFILVLLRRCLNDQIVIGYYNRSTSPQTIPPHTLRIGVLRFQ